MTLENERKKREKIFHDERYDSVDLARQNTTKYYSLFSNALSHYQKIALNNCKKKHLLEYGCGTGSSSHFWAKHGAIVTGIDISSAGIKKAKQKSSQSKFNISYHIMDAEELGFQDSSF